MAWHMSSADSNGCIVETGYLALAGMGGTQQAGSAITQGLSLMRGSMTKANITGRLSLMQWRSSVVHGSMRKANTAGRLSETQALMLHGREADAVCNQCC